MDLEKTIDEYELVVLDLETSGKYPIESQICEIAAVKFKDGKIIDTYQTLVKPDQPMSDFVIGIHHITNEMVSPAPKIKDVIGEFREFCEGGICVAHHAPFDLGFLAYDFERQNLSLPEPPVICTSLLARAVIADSENHRLQTLMKYFNVSGGSAHRALDDAKSCLTVLLGCIQKMTLNPKLSDLLQVQGGALHWRDFSLEDLRKDLNLKSLLMAIENKNHVEIVYSGGSKPGKPREVSPVSVVRNPEGDYLVASDLKSPKTKRYYLKKISAVNAVSN